MDTSYIVPCPHCKLLIQIYREDVKCAIFRHGVYKKTLKQINPHAKKNVCDNLAKEKLIIGCGKPFKLIINDKDNVEAKICDYI